MMLDLFIHEVKREVKTLVSVKRLERKIATAYGGVEEKGLQGGEGSKSGGMKQYA
jgi:hypothetical protein